MITPSGAIRFIFVLMVASSGVLAGSAPTLAGNPPSKIRFFNFGSEMYYNFSGGAGTLNPNLPSFTPYGFGEFSMADSRRHSTEAFSLNGRLGRYSSLSVQILTRPKPSENAALSGFMIGYRGSLHSEVNGNFLDLIGVPLGYYQDVYTYFLVIPSIGGVGIRPKHVEAGMDPSLVGLENLQASICADGSVQIISREGSRDNPVLVLNFSFSKTTMARTDRTITPEGTESKIEQLEKGAFRNSRIGILLGISKSVMLQLNGSLGEFSGRRRIYPDLESAIKLNSFETTQELKQRCYQVEAKLVFNASQWGR